MTACAVEIGLADHLASQEAADLAYEADVREKEEAANNMLAYWQRDAKALEGAIGDQVGGAAWEELMEAMQAAAEAQLLKHPEERRLAAKVAGDKLLKAMETMALVAVGGDVL